jgi:hypothetical protein
MRIQKKIIGQVRRRLSGYLAKEIKNQVERESKRYGVSKSFVIANACAYAFGIPTESYIEAGAKNVIKFRKRRKAS